MAQEVCITGPTGGTPLAVSSGALPTSNLAATTVGTTLNGVAGTSTGTAVNFGQTVSVAAVGIVGAGTLTGTFAVQLSLDGNTWYTSGTVPAALTAGAATYTPIAGTPAPQWRVNFTATGGTGTVTVKIVGAL